MKDGPRGSIEGRAWFESQQAKNPFTHECFATTNVKPHKIDPKMYGHHRSYVIVLGLRHWAFQELKGKELLLRNFPDDVMEYGHA